jgi:DNA polymerase II small subunit/DNA polymerase delta subunit B
MDLLQKIETLLNATARAGLPRRQRRSLLNEQEAQLLADVRQALAAVEFQERALAERLKMEHSQAQEAAQTGDRAEQRAHEKRAVELERELEQESIQAINLEDKLKTLEEKLALAKEAVEKQAKIAAAKDEAAAKAMGGSDVQAETSTTSSDQATPADFSDDVPAVAARKSRLSG